MKKKFKAVQEFYNHAQNTLLNSKVEGLSSVFQKESTVDQASIDVLSLEMLVENHRQLHSGEASVIALSFCKNTSSEAFQSLDSMKASGLLEYQPVLQNICTQSTLERQVQDVLDCRGNDISCVSKEDGEVMIIGDQSGDADDKNVVSGSASVTITNGSLADHMSVEESDHNSVKANSCGTVLPEKGFCEELNPLFQNQNVLHGDGAEELVDVRVCDTCGDAGREALLVLCSNCSDGAEHIYCMTPMMDKVPESDWLCEDCALLREPKRHKQAVVERSDNALKPSYSKELSQGSPSIYTAIKHVGKIHLSKSSRASDKRLGPFKDVSLKPKKRTVDQKGQLPKISRSMEKRKNSTHQVSPSVELPAKKVVKHAGSSCRKSPIPEQQFCEGKNLEVQCSREDFNQRSSSKENAACELEKKHPEKKVSKDLPCNGVGPISLNVSNPCSSMPTIEFVKGGSGNHSAENSSQENETSKLRQTSVVSKIVMRENLSRKNFDNNPLQVNGDTIVETLGSLVNERKICMNTSGAGSVEETNSPCYVVISPAVKSDGYSDQRVSLTSQKAKIDDEDQSPAGNKIQPIDLGVLSTLDPVDINHTVPSAISAVPDSRSIWKGSFKLDNNRKLSSHCYGVQAHLSTHASSEVDELVFKFSTELRLKEVPRVHTWPIKFQKNHPTEQDIALYFFAQDLLSYETSYRKLLECMTSNDLALESNLGDFQLLVFPSYLLPEKSQRWNSLPYLWGVFRVRKLDDSCVPNLNVSPVNQHSGFIIRESECKSVSPSFSGSLAASRTSNKSLGGEEFVDPLVLQSSASVKSRDQSSEREVPSLEEYTLKKHQLQISDDLGTKGFYSGLQSDDFQKGWIFSDEDVMSPYKFRCGESMTPVGFYSDGASGSSLSLDSGPSGLTDSGWCAKSAEEVMFENPGSYDIDLNLNLCLGPGPEPDTDLVLGFPSSSAYQPKDYSKNSSTLNQLGNASIGLSLGIPSSDW